MRKKLAKLVQHVNMFNFHCTEESPEYKLLENIITDEQIDVVLALKVRVPYTYEEVAKRANISVEKATKLCDELCMIGVMEYEDEKVKVPVFAPGSMELMMLNKNQIEAHPEVAESFINYVEGLSKQFVHMFPKGNGLVIAIPIEKEIEAEPKSVGIEHLSYWVEKYAPSLSVADCQCRRAGEMTGNIGADVARTAVRSGADKVMMYALEAYDELPMGLEDKAECEAEGISVNGGWGPAEIMSKDGKVTGIKFKKCTSVRDSSGAFAPVFDESEVIELECSTVLYCTGQKIDLKDMLKGTKVEFNKNGTIVANPFTYQTAEEDIFVGGDAYTGQKFAIDAIAAGKQGADSLHRFSHEGHCPQKTYAIRNKFCYNPSRC